MTIVFQGHVDNIRNSGGGVVVTVITEQAICGQSIDLRMSHDEAKHWMPGRVVSITAYTLPEPEHAAKLKGGA